MNTAFAVRAYGLYFIGNVKMGHFGYPVTCLKEQRIQRRDDLLEKEWTVMLVRKVAEFTPQTEKLVVYAASHGNKNPLVLSIKLSMSTQGKETLQLFKQ